MGFNRDTIRSKAFSLLVVPLLALTAVWAYVAVTSVAEATGLLRSGERYTAYLQPLENLSDALRQERRYSVIALYDERESAREDLSERRTGTDRALADFREATASQDATTLPSTTSLLLARLDGLTAIRGSVDGGVSTAVTTVGVYSDLVDEISTFSSSLAKDGGLTPEQYSQVRSLNSLDFGLDLLARENSLIGYAIADKDLSPSVHASFVELVTSRRFLLRNEAAALDPDVRAGLEQLYAKPVYSALTEGENRIVAFVPTDGELPYGLEQWLKDGVTVTTEVDALTGAAMDRAMGAAGQRVSTILWQTAFITGLGLIIVIVSVLISVRFGRRVVRELGDLELTAVDVARSRLPDLVRRLRAGESVDPAAETPTVAEGKTMEIRNVSGAFNFVLAEAVRASVGQAELRRSIGQVFLNLARRNQSLLHRQLSLLEVMEHRVEDPATLEDLFRLDHLSTRMRRHAENLIILSGAAPSRRWREPVPIFDLVRGAVTEVEDYTRVVVQEMRQAPTVQGSAVNDLMHLVAELIENATVFSPPGTRVYVRGEVAANGYALEIEDRGLGLDHAKLETLNQRIAEPPEFDLADSERLGLFVVARLAARHGVRVLLRRSPYEGVTAIVMIPPALLAAPDEQKVSYFTTQAPPVQPPPARHTPAPQAAAPVVHDDFDDFGLEGLPQRVPQTHLVAPLRGEAPQRSEPQQADEGSAERRAGLMTSMQRGWERGRRETGIWKDRPHG
ncbi:sensor histidine kinase [Herbidospora sp. RD11066]